MQRSTLIDACPDLLADDPHDPLSRGVLGQYDTPVICFLLDRLSANAARFITRAGPGIHPYFSVKSCYAPPAIETLHQDGLGMEVCSEFEHALVRRVGVPPERIRWHALALSRSELEIVTSGEVELVTLSNLRSVRDLAEAMEGRSQTLNIALRVQTSGTNNPYLGGGTRLGFSRSGPHLREAIRLSFGASGLRLVGLHAHSHIEATDASGHESTARQLAELGAELRDEFGLSLREISVGGGFARASRFDPASLANIPKIVAERIGPSVTIVVEPGRHFVENAGVAFTRVLAVHDADDQKWCIVDIGTNLLLPFGGREFDVALAPHVVEGDSRFSIGDRLSSFSGVIRRHINARVPEVGDVVRIDNVGSYTLSTLQKFMYGLPTVVAVKSDRPCWARSAETPAEWSKWWFGGASDEQ